MQMPFGVKRLKVEEGKHPGKVSHRTTRRSSNWPEYGSLPNSRESNGDTAVLSSFHATNDVMRPMLRCEADPAAKTNKWHTSPGADT